MLLPVLVTVSEVLPPSKRALLPCRLVVSRPDPPMTVSVPREVTLSEPAPRKTALLPVPVVIVSLPEAA